MLASFFFGISLEKLSAVQDYYEPVDPGTQLATQEWAEGVTWRTNCKKLQVLGWSFNVPRCPKHPQGSEAILHSQDFLVIIWFNSWSWKHKHPRSLHETNAGTSGGLELAPSLFHRAAAVPNWDGRWCNWCGKTWSYSSVSFETGMPRSQKGVSALLLTWVVSNNWVVGFGTVVTVVAQQHWSLPAAAGVSSLAAWVALHNMRRAAQKRHDSAQR